MNKTVQAINKLVEENGGEVPTPTPVKKREAPADSATKQKKKKVDAASDAARGLFAKTASA